MSNFYINIFLKETYKNLGQYELITDKDIIGDLTAFTLTQNTQTVVNNVNTQNQPDITITGLTSSKLNTVRTYNPQEPYKVNVNGVTKVTNEFIEYKIGDVEYKTFLSDGLTIFKAIKKPEIFDNQPVIWNSNSVFIDIKKTLNAMVIERNNISVYDYFNKINNCSELDDLLDIF